MARDTEVQEQYELLSEKIRRLRKDHAIAIEPHKFNLEQQLQESEQERAKLEKQLSFLEEDRIILNLTGMPNEVHCIFNSHAQIGRSPSCRFWIDDESEEVSRLQAVLSYKSDNNEYWIEDLQSVNGTYVEETKIQKPTRLLGGTKIQLGESFSFLFEHDKNDPLSPGVMIQRDDDGKEWARYILIPKGKALIGTNAKEVIRFPKFREQHSLGSLEKRGDEFYLISVNNKETLLQHNHNLELDFFEIEVSILSIVSKENLTQTNVIKEEPLAHLKTKEEIEPKLPSGDEFPPNIRTIRIVLGLFVLIVGIILPFSFLKSDQNKILSSWIHESANFLQDTNSKFWNKNATFPPELMINLVSSKQGNMKQFFLEESSLSDKINQDRVYPVLTSYNWSEVFQFIKNSEVFQFIKNNDPKREEFWLAIEERNTLGWIGLRITYWTPDLIDRPTFQWEEEYFLYRDSLIILFVTLLISSFIDNIIVEGIVEGYRNKLQDDYNNFQKRRTEKIFAAKSNLEEARKLAQLGKLAKSLNKINHEVLNSISKSMPLYKETIYLKNTVLKQIEAGGGVITVEPLNINRSSSTNTSKLLYLRILGTPYAYQVPYGFETIYIGRQRRKPNTTDNVGNDVILRVPGSDPKSLRISRRHLEIKRIDTEYFVIDKSGGQTKLNGTILTQDEPVRLQSRDRLFIAGVLTLEVLIRLKVTGTKIDNVLNIDSPEYQDSLVIEASIGDMVTEVFDD